MGNLTQPKVKQTREIAQFGVSVELESFDLSSGIDKILPCFRDEVGIAQALGMMRAMGGDKAKGLERAVYVIGVEDRDISKIGVSADPMGRLGDLQGCHYRKLYLHGLVFPVRRHSVSIEQAALRTAREAGNGLNGEWVSMKPQDALRLVVETARDGKWNITDARGWYRNVICRVKARAKDGRCKKYVA